MKRVNLQAARCRGFTLIELLISMTILALVLGLIVTSLGFSVRTADAVERRISSSEQVHLVHRALRRQIQLAAPILRQDSEAGDEIHFAGGIKTLEFAAPVPGIEAYAGLYGVTLVIEDDTRIGGSDGRLVLKFRVLSEVVDETPRANDEYSVVVLDGLSGAEFAYRGAEMGASDQWVSQWRDTKRLPALVRLQLRFSGSGHVVPDLVIALRSTTPNRYSG